MGSVREHLELARRRLAVAGIEQPAREAALLLRTLLGMSEAALLAHDQQQVPPALGATYDERIARRARHAPTAYLIGEREFYARPFAVDERVLIPRPESEQLISIALDLPLPANARVLDIATGSGCVAVTLAAERPGWRVVASDLSPAALAVARRNLGRHGVADRVALVAADLTRGLGVAAFDLVVANPPYVDRDAHGSLPADVRDHEPSVALLADDGGRSILARLLRELAAMQPRGWFVCEHGAGQRHSIVAVADRVGGWRLESQHDDLAGIDRNLLWRRQG